MMRKTSLEKPCSVFKYSCKVCVSTSEPAPRRWRVHALREDTLRSPALMARIVKSLAHEEEEEPGKAVLRVQVFLQVWRAWPTMREKDLEKP